MVVKNKILRSLAISALEWLVPMILIILIISFGFFIYHMIAKEENLSSYLYAYTVGCGLITNLVFAWIRSPIFIEKSPQESQERIYYAGLLLFGTTILLLLLSGWVYTMTHTEGGWISEEVKERIILISSTFFLFISFIPFTIGLYRIISFLHSSLDVFIDRNKNIK